VLIAHLSDLHLRDTGDVAWLDRQLSRIAAQHPAHLAVTGDLLDRWDPLLLERALDAFAAHGFLDGERMTLLHGNHDLASSGGHPRRNADLFRLMLRFWDPPPLVRQRRATFHAAIEARATHVAKQSPWIKRVVAGFRIAVLDTVPLPWRPFRFQQGAIVVQHAVGCVNAREAAWLAEQRDETPLVVLVHHYPLAAPQFTWTADRHDARLAILRPVIREVHVPMAIPESQREHFWAAARAAGVRLILCGHVHRARLEWHEGIAVGLNGQSGAEWAGRTIAFYDISPGSIVRRSEQVG
jgi:predicted MPP superfamily phosphohydrolase